VTDLNLENSSQLEEIAKHPYLASNPKPPSMQLFEEVVERATSKDEDFIGSENLDLAILASLGVVLKVSTLYEVKEMLINNR